jgi:hypothetical protein
MTEEELSRRGKSFYAMLEVLAQIKGGRDLSLDKDTAQLWLYTLAGMGYARKTRGFYTITERGEQELERHRGATPSVP